MIKVLKDIFGFETKNDGLVGLSQLKQINKPVGKKTVIKKNKELKISDIMKGTSAE